MTRTRRFFLSFLLLFAFALLLLSLLPFLLLNSYGPSRIHSAILAFAFSYRCIVCFPSFFSSLPRSGLFASLRFSFFLLITSPWFLGSDDERALVAFSFNSAYHVEASTEEQVQTIQAPNRNRKAQLSAPSSPSPPSNDVVHPPSPRSAPPSSLYPFHSNRHLSTQEQPTLARRT